MYRLIHTNATLI